MYFTFYAPCESKTFCYTFPLKEETLKGSDGLHFIHETFNLQTQFSSGIYFTAENPSQDYIFRLVSYRSFYFPGRARALF